MMELRIKKKNCRAAIAVLGTQGFIYNALALPSSSMWGMAGHEEMQVQREVGWDWASLPHVSALAAAPPEVPGSTTFPFSGFSSNSILFWQPQPDLSHLTSTVRHLHSTTLCSHCSIHLILWPICRSLKGKEDAS